MDLISKRTSVVRDYEGERRAEGTFAHLRRGWFPVDPELLERVKEKLDSGVYDCNRMELRADLKEDLALFTHSLKSISNRNDRGNGGEAPLAMIDSISADELRSLFALTPFQISRFRVAASSRIHTATLALSMASALGAEEFASAAVEGGVTIDGDDAFSCAALRQIGFNLFAWNYTTLYSRLARASGGNLDELERSLYRSFNVSPKMLGRQFASEWGMGVDVRRGLENRPRAVKDGDEHQSVIRFNPLLEICELAEIFGQAQDPKRFPKARYELEKRREANSDIISDARFSTAKSNIEHTLSERLERILVPRKVGMRTRVSLADRVSELREVAIAENPYVRRCPEKLREMFQALYHDLPADGADPKALQMLLQRIVPQAGFRIGAVFLVDRNRQVVPKVRLGTFGREDEEIATRALTDLAKRCVDQRIARREQVVTPLGSSVTHLGVGFEGGVAKGVFVVESSDSRLENDDLVIFKALHFALVRCLGLS